MQLTAQVAFEHAAVPLDGVGHGAQETEVPQPVSGVLPTHTPLHMWLGNVQVPPLLELAATELLVVLLDVVELLDDVELLDVVEPPGPFEALLELSGEVVVVLDVAAPWPPFPPRPPTPPDRSVSEPCAQAEAKKSPSVHHARPVQA